MKIYGCYTKGMDVIPNWDMDVIPKVCMLYLRYGCYTKCMDVWMSHLYTYKAYTNKWLVDVFSN